ncbi:MAG: hypothetical protein J0H41_10055 [Rhizobiales bacterium]|nr:hypothetical protein [Hyphomicrobiales bacterium]
MMDRRLKNLCASVAVFCASSAAVAQEPSHPADLLKQPDYRAAWTALMKGEKFARRDSWIPKMQGPGSTTRYRDPHGGDWIEGNVCQPHNCGDNNLIVLADPKTKRIYAAQRTRGDLPRSERFFGQPDAETRKLLSQRIIANFP